MKKALISLLALFCTTAFTFAQSGAQPDGSSHGAVTTVDMKTFVDMMKKVQAYIFLGKDESRELKQTFNRSEQIDFYDDIDNLVFSVSNPDIAAIDTAEGTITGKQFGQTILVAHDTKTDAEAYFAIFVSPTITVVSPEGAIYKYQKTYGQPAHIQLTKSNDYLINCVMRFDGSEWVDITDMVAMDSDGSNDGYYESTDGIRHDLTFSISEESRLENDGDDIGMVGGSGLNVRVQGTKVTFVTDDEAHTPLAGKKVTVKDTADNELFTKATSTDGSVEIPYPGVYVIFVDGYSGHFKVLIHPLD